MVAALQQQLFTPVGKGLLDFHLVLLDAGDVALLVPRPAEEVAEFAVGDADVGGVGVAVNDPSDYATGHMVLAQAVAHVHQFGGGRIFQQKNTFLGAEVVEAEGSVEQVVGLHDVILSYWVIW